MKLFNLLGYSKKETDDWSLRAQKAAVAFGNESKSLYNNDTPYLVYEQLYDGEKTQGELGAPLAYYPDYNSLSYRSWQAYTESDLAQIIINSHVNWVVGSGLKLEAEPNENIIKQEGFEFNRTEFTKTIENRFRMYAKIRNASHSKMKNYNELQRQAYINAIVGGDVLCVLRLKNGLPTMQCIDGIHVQTPGMDEIERAKSKGHKIKHGVELDKNNTHIAYYVKQKEGEIKRVLAHGEKTGRMQAFLLYGTEYRIDSVRGMPLLSAVLEKMKKLDRYNEAVVASAEERAKTPWWFEHKEYSDGTNPDLAQMAANMTAEQRSESSVIDMDEQKTLIKRTYEKDAINLPVGATIKRLESENGTEHEAFTTANFIYICAATDTPYEVALMKYVNSFSSSRMASQTWQSLLLMKRIAFDSFNKPFYDLFMDSQILSGKVQADGYFTAMNSNDVILLQAYRNARFIGPSVPQADPLKEVKAEELKVKNYFSTYERSMERLGNSEDFDTTIDRLSAENKLINEKIPDQKSVETTTTNEEGD